MQLIQACRAGLGAMLRSLGVDAATAHAPGFEEAWRTVGAVPGWFARENGAAFWGVISERRPSVIVEVGSYQGRSTTLLGKALEQFSHAAKLVAIDPHTGDRQALETLNSSVLPTADLFRMHTAGAGIAKVLDARIATSADVAAGWDGTPVDLIFVDGWHSYAAVIADSDGWIPHLSAHGLVCFDDFGNYPEVAEAVRESCAKHGLHLYGSVVAQAWAGRDPHPPVALKAAIRWLGRLRK